MFSNCCQGISVITIVFIPNWESTEMKSLQVVSRCYLLSYLLPFGHSKSKQKRKLSVQGSWQWLTEKSEVGIRSSLNWFPSLPPQMKMMFDNRKCCIHEATKGIRIAFIFPTGWHSILSDVALWHARSPIMRSFPEGIIRR
jgi:hypothetical protein